MAKIITSDSVVFMDNADNRKLDVYITSNLPTVQIKNVNTNEYTPNWASTPLVLKADVYLDSKNVTDNTTFAWYKKDVNGIETHIDNKTKTITIGSNDLDGDQLVTYVCRALYRESSVDIGIEDVEYITFSQVTTGLDGSSGADGTSVTILGSYDTLSALQTAHPIGNPGDAYLIDGHLYVWAIDNAQWDDVGNIQGPAGKDGENAKNIILTGDTQVFKVSKTNAYTPSTISITAQAINTNITSWSYSVNGGAFQNVTPTGVTRNGNVITVSGQTLAANSLVVKCSDGQYSDVFTVYKAFDGADGKGEDGVPAPIAFLTNENVSFAANSNGVINNSTSLRVTTNVVAYVGTKKQMPVLGDILDKPSGMNISIEDDAILQEKKLTITFDSDATLGSVNSNSGTITIPVITPVVTNLKLNWSKINTGAKGDNGADAYTVLLTNESHVFAGSISAAIASSATTQVLAYKGAESQSVTIVSVNGVTASTALTATGIAGLSFKCSVLSGTSPTITFTCTTSFVSANGTIPIVIKVGSISITKMFTYSIAFKGNTGATGGTGPQGSSATSYWLMSSASVVQKSASGTIVLTPSTLTFTGKSQTGTSTPIDYGCRWIIAYSTDGSTYTNAYTSTSNETTKTFTADSTYKTIRVRMYLAGGTTTLLDEQIIPVVTDGAIGTPGADAVTFQVYSSNGYALSINTPTVTLQTFAYIGDVAITAGATYQWYVYNDSGWTAISGGTNAYLAITREDVAFSKSYMCKMTFNGVEYSSVATIDDKNDENKVFTTKPSNYAAGDLWVVGVDYAPAGVTVGTLLRAEHTNVTYGDVDWVTATKYDKELNDLKDNIETYNQYFSFDSTEGLKISAKDNNGTPSQFSTSLTNERLSFNYGSEAIAYINGTKMNIKEAEIESPLTVTGKYSGSTMLQAPVINIGNFSIIVESNGSLSIVANI